MNELNMTYEAIASNENLSDPLKEQFMGLTQVFHQTFENVNLDNYNERIKSLRIKRGSKLFIKTDSEYSPRENILYLNEDKLMETDACHSMMMRTLEMVTAKDNYYGINDNGKLEGINAGLTEIIANNLVGNEGAEKHCDEMVLTNLITEVAGFNNALNAYFNNNSAYFTKPFIRTCNDPEKAMLLLDEIQYNYEMKERLGYSNLGKLQKRIVEIGLSENNIEYFKNNVVTNPEMLSNNIKYDNLSEVNSYLQMDYDIKKVA